MTSFAHFLRLTTPLFAALLLFVPTGSFGEVGMEVMVGFDGVVKESAWSPIAVELTNSTDQDIEGTIEVEQTESPESGTRTCAARVNLPANSKKLYHVYKDMSGYGNNAFVTLRGRRAVLRQKVKVQHPSADDMVVVTVGDRASRLNFLSQETIAAQHLSGRRRGSSSTNDATIFVGSIAPRMLPDRPAAYEGVDLLIASRMSPASVNPKALAAIGMWVASGGTLVVPVGPNVKSYRNAFYDEMLPVTLTGTANLPGLTCLDGRGGAFPAGPVTVATSAPKPGIGRVTASESGIPITAQRAYGAGRVIYIALDAASAPFKDWSGQANFWKSILTGGVSEPLVPSATILLADGQQGYHGHDMYWMGDQGSMVPLVSQTPSIMAPSLNTVGLFLVSYLVALVPVNYLVLRRKRRLELAWVSTPMIVVVFSLGAYAIGYTMKGGELRLQEATVIETSSGSRYAGTLTDASVFSPARRSYDIEFAGEHTLGQVVAFNENERLPAAYIGESSAIESVQMAMWSSKTLESAGGLDLGGPIDAKLVLEGNRIRGEICNNTRLSLRSCEVVYGGGLAQLGDLAPGASRKLDIRFSPYQSRIPQYTPSNPGQLTDSLRLHAKAMARGSGGPVLVARPDAGHRVFGIRGRKASVTSVSCLACRLNYDIGSTFSFSPQMIGGWLVVAMENAYIEYPHTSPVTVRLSSGGYLTAVYRIPLPAGAVVTSLKWQGSIKPSGGGPAPAVVTSLYNHATGAWDAMPLTPGRPVPNPARYVGPGGDVKVKAKLVAGGSDAVVSYGISVEGRRNQE